MTRHTLINTVSQSIMQTMKPDFKFGLIQMLHLQHTLINPSRLHFRENRIDDDDDDDSDDDANWG